MPASAGSGSGKRKLRRLLGLFFIALAIPSAILTWQAYSRLQWESFHQYQLLAEELLGRIDRHLRDLIAKEQARAFTDYRFLVVQGAPAANYLQRSPLSGFPVDSAIPGLLGYFQLDGQGRFTTPLLPDDPGISALAYGVADAELRQRRALRERLLKILSQEGLVSGADHARTQGAAGERSAPAAASAPGRTVAHEDSAPGTLVDAPEQELAQAAFDRLSEAPVSQRKASRQQGSLGNIGRVDELKLDRAFGADWTARQARSRSPGPKEPGEYSAARREQSVEPAAVPTLVEAVAQREADARDASRTLVRMFESEVEPFELGLVGSGHFVLYRKVWREGRRHIQGAVIDRAEWLRELIETPYRDTALATMSRLGIVFDGEILSALGGQGAGGYLSRAEELSGTLLYRGRLSTPLDAMELIFSVTSMPSGAAGGLVVWVALTLALVSSGGLALMYRLGVKQIELNHQQRDFVSAVSHELKTPLTSIRMYSEMLREGWADEARKRSYYDFIHDESERLSRLISNVLQLARMGRGELKVEPAPIGVRQLMDVVHSKVSTQVSHAGFALRLHCSERAAQQTIEVDRDAFVQILINLVDNAIKFSARADERLIEIGCRWLDDASVQIGVRDHGPGIPKNQMKKIFELFYRSENELTRETTGTGIGLALVQRLASSMGGEVDVVNRDPGAEFRVRFAVLKAGSR